MSTPEVNSAPDPDAAKAVDVVSDPAKLVTLLALATFDPEKRTTFSDLAERANELQGPDPVREYTSEVVRRHCKLILLRRGLVELDKSPLPDRRGPDPTTAKLTGKGWSDGLAEAGAHLDLQLSAPQPQFLEAALGTVDNAKPRDRRPLLYRELLKGTQSITNLAANTGLVLPKVSVYVRNLVEQGILENVDLCDPLNRTYTIADPNEHRIHGGPVVNSAVEVITGYYERGWRQVTGQDILRQTTMLQPDLSPQQTWEKFSQWANRNRVQFIQLATQPHKQRSEVRISDMYRPHIERLLEIRRLLTEDSPKAEKFRRESRDIALALIKPYQSELIRQALAPRILGPLAVHQQTNWQAIAEEIVIHQGGKGMPAKELHQQVIEVTGKHIGYGHFCMRLEQSGSLYITKQILTGRAGKQAKLVTARHSDSQPKTFSSNWRRDAACRNEDLNLFFPPAGLSLTDEQAEQAKAVCAKCPVRMPCLRVALDDPYPFGVRGGIWMERQEITPAKKATIIRTVHITPHP